MPALTFLIFAIVLGLFSLAFILLGRSNERAYWSQRDPSGDSRKDATPFGTIFMHTLHYAAGEYRAPLRIIAIGVLMLWIAMGFLLISILMQVL
ncbi:MAG: hypothetical protein WCJ73_09015 [Actinomycetes bacterium]